MSNVVLSIIIVNWNGEKFLPSCIESIVKNSPPFPYEIVVVDNDSSDNSIEWFAKAEAQNLLAGVNYRIIQTGSNLGFGKANNMGFQNTSSPFVFVLNPDALVQPKALEKLLHTLESNDEIGMVAPKLLGADKSVQSNVWDFPPSATKFLFSDFHLHKFLPISKKVVGNWLLKSHWSYDEKRAVPIVSGAAMMVKREVIEQTGGFDPDLFMYGEDFDWCVRIRNGGWKIYFEPEAAVIHIGGESSKQVWSLVEQRMKEEKAFLGFLEKFLTPFQLVRIASARLLIASSLKLKNKIQKRETVFFDKQIDLQKEGIRRAIHKIFGVKRNSDKISDL